MNDSNNADIHDLGASKCSGGWEAHEAHMEMNGECPWCGSFDKSKWLD